MNQLTQTLEKQRLQELFDNCQQQVLSQIMGPFGLSTAMFEDKNGGNVATVHNANQSIFPDAMHEKNFAIANINYNQEIRQKHWDDTSARWSRHKANNQKIDAGQEVLSDATKRPMVKGDIHGDHVVSLKENHDNKSFHLRFSEEERKAIVNNEKNMAYIEGKLNMSKGKKSWDECLSDPEFVKANNLSRDEIENIKKIDKEARDYLKGAENKRLASELLSTGTKEAAMMGVRQALGMLLTELVNQLFNEIKDLYREGVDSGKALLQQLKFRSKKIIDALLKKLPDVLNQVFEGGLSGFASNLITFLINTFISTAKNVVKIIREGLLSLFKAVKMILFPKSNVNKQENLKAALKLITTAVFTSIGIFFEESFKAFFVAIPVVGVFADTLAPVFMGILVGISSALIAYAIDRLFDKYGGPSFDEKMLDEIIDNSNLQNKFADDLFEQLDFSMMAIENYQYSIRINQDIAEQFAGALASNDYTIYLLEHDVISTKQQIKKTIDAIKCEEDFIANLDSFLITQEKGN
ncbi:hypothetical protein [Shewanella subflava]|uniref:Cation diffusion facilitator family transporter n=1 Tax=Shewanella subflava TaxID=2986476 RepID=A0ABT3I5N6_9GAMM|nr:hypothetical protein [Shewanella subflava]MCW3171386.1 hypothetical protein [Shewanella subflava]